MAEERILVYGLGKVFQKFKKHILDEYKPCGFCDFDANKIVSIPNGVSCDELKNTWQNYTSILVVGVPLQAIMYLTEDLAVPDEKIRIFRYEYEERQKGERFYGEHLEDALLLHLLEKMNKSINKIRYLEIGTNDPVINNNTYALYRKGARGILVDPLPTVALLARKSRPEDRFINAAVTDNDNAIDNKTVFYYCPHDLAISSLSKKTMMKKK